MKIAKINQNRDFRRAYSKGKYAAHDIVLVARAKTPLAKSTQIAPVLQKHLQKLGLMKYDQKMDALDDPDVPEISV